MEDKFYRNRLLYGNSAVEKLKESKVIIFGLGGVGGYVFESFLRMGIENIDIVDFDKINQTNINRQIIATDDTVGMFKTDACIERAKAINENVKINAFKLFFDSSNSQNFNFRNYDYIVDCIDSVKSKIELIKKANEDNSRIISSMGAGFRFDPSRVDVDDIYNTSYCPLARVMRSELKKLKIKKLKVVYSKEMPVKSKEQTGGIVASSIFVPAAFGLKIAQIVVEDLIN